MHLLVTPAGGRLWRLKYRIGGKEKQLALGSYPEVGLKEARDRREAAKRATAQGHDPSRQKRLAKQQGASNQGSTFETVARDWHGRQKARWVGRHAGDVIDSLECLVFPMIGSMHIDDITPPRALDVVRNIELNNGGETARRVRQRVSAVFCYAIATGVGETDPAAIIKGALSPVRKGRMPAVAMLEAAREVLKVVEAVPAHPATKAAHRFLALTLVRPENINGARWDEIDVTADLPDWHLTAERMKMKEPHVVPLSRQAVAVLDAMRPHTGRGPMIFPNARFAHRPMSENAMGYLLQRAGLAGQHVPHGWRATFSSIMNERFQSDHDVIDRILAHSTRDKVRGAYNRAQYMDRRRELLQIWADFLLEGAEEITEVLDGPRRPLKQST